MENHFKYVDFGYLNRWVNGNLPFITNMIELFIQSTPEILQGLEQDVRAQNWEKVEMDAHTFASQLVYMGMDDTSKAVREIEELATKQDPENKIPGMLPGIINTCNLALEELKNINLSNPDFLSSGK